MARLLFILPVLALVFLPVYFLFLQSPPPVPNVDMNEWWGPESGKEKQDTSIRPFKISFGNNVSFIYFLALQVLQKQNSFFQNF